MSEGGGGEGGGHKEESFQVADHIYQQLHK